jgi:hypothetical protein
MEASVLTFREEEGIELWLKGVELSDGWLQLKDGPVGNIIGYLHLKKLQGDDTYKVDRVIGVTVGMPMQFHENVAEDLINIRGREEQDGV